MTPPVSSAPVNCRNCFVTSLPWPSLPHGSGIPTLKWCHSGGAAMEQSSLRLKYLFACPQPTTVFQKLGRCHKAAENNVPLAKVRASTACLSLQWMAEKHQKCTAHTGKASRRFQSHYSSTGNPAAQSKHINYNLCML